MPVKSRTCRKRGRPPKVMSSWKSAGHPSLGKKIADGKGQPCKQYAPCGCQFLCGKQCPCVQNGTCCEKYCRCSKSCKNRFRGCYCAKSQCKSRQCPCFAAGRECDPDVCRNCWVSCVDGSLDEPPRRGDGQCGNMELLLRQQKTILMPKSDAAGWGALPKNSVNKNDNLGEYTGETILMPKSDAAGWGVLPKNSVNKNDNLGEYTGELISHQEADKQGKIYDRANQSFLFDLNEKYVPDANESIEAGEELFDDYRYGPDQAPA